MTNASTGWKGLLGAFIVRKYLLDPRKRKRMERIVSSSIYLFFYLALGPFYYLVNKLFFNNNRVINYHAKQSTLLFIISCAPPSLLGFATPFLFLVNKSFTRNLIFASIWLFVTTEIILGIFLTIKTYRNSKQNIFPFIKL
jgi:hypothetical protein